MTVTPAAPPPGHSEALGSLRGLAAAVVVVYHGLMIARLGPIDDAHDLPIDPGSPALLVQHVLLSVFNGSAAVIVFFVLSGAVLALSLERSPVRGAVDLLAYYVKRGFRLAPLLVAAALLGAALHLAWFDGTPAAYATSWMNWHYAHEPDAVEVAANAIGWSNSLNSPAWTIFVEIVASIAFPFLFLLARRGLRGPALVAIVALALVPLPLRGVHVFMVCFFVGALVAGEPGRRVAGHVRAWPRPARVASIVGALVLLGWFQRVHAPAAFVDPVVVLVNTAAAAFLVTLIYHGRPVELLRSARLQRLGEVSYGLYLLHFPVLFVLAHAVAPLVPEPLPAGAAIALNLALALATLALTVPLAAFTYRALERPLQEAGRAVARRVRAGRFSRAAGTTSAA